jgi:pimeloyl-ACP methyl ester carboxylesterase
MTRGRAALGAALGIFGGMVAGAAPASAALDFQPCADAPSVQCAQIQVPIDRSGAVPGTFSLLVHRVPAPHPAGRPPLVFLAGGPGQTSTNFTTSVAKRFATALGDRDLIVFAQRGSGPTAISCPELDRGDPQSTAVPACADRLGAARSFYTTRDGADDLDAIRQALGADKLALFGVSYGSWFARGYAIRHPEHVERIVLDSTFGPNQNADPFGVQQFKAAPDVARAICHRNACRGISKDLYADVLRLFAQLQAKPIDAVVVDPTGAKHKVSLGALPVAALLPELDMNPYLRAQLPRAVAGALKGDASTLARLVAGGPTGAPPDPVRAINQGLFVATRCEEDVHPFDRTASVNDRIAQARGQLATIPASTFEPFGSEIAFALSTVPTCAYWPMAPAVPSPGSGPPANVPVLLLHGEFDLRTPRSATDTVAAEFPQAEVLTVPNTGHSAVRTDAAGCARKATVAFFSKGTVTAACKPQADPFAARALLPGALAQVRPARGFTRTSGRAVAAALLTVSDGFDQLDLGTSERPDQEATVSGGGLRGGSFKGSAGGPVFSRYELVKGFPVSGKVRPTGTVVLKVPGGVLRFAQNGKVTGRLGGKPVSGRARLQRLTITARLAQVAGGARVLGRLALP